MTGQRDPPFSDEEVSSLIEDVEISIDGDDEPIALRDLMADVTAGHYELDSYKRGGLTYAEALDDEIEAAKNRGDEMLVDLLEEVRRAAFGLYLRVKRGDDELLGDRDGEYNGYFESEESIPTTEPDY